MKRALSAAVVVLLLPAPAAPQTTAPDAAELTALLKQFLDGASRSDPAVHERFWAEDLVYTSAAGRRKGKADILRELRSAPPPAVATTYGAEDVRIQQHGDAAIVAFRLVGTTQKDGQAEVARYLNTGTFLKRQGKWQAVAWQATRMTGPEEEARKRSALVDALVVVVALEHVWFLVLEMFLWTQPLGRRVFRLSEEQARSSAALAANQGLYNGFLAAGLVWGLLAPPAVTVSIEVFFLACVVVAGVFGAFTVSRRILMVQALPAALALFLVLASR
jgi:putative membrane protein